MREVHSPNPFDRVYAGDVFWMALTFMTLDARAQAVHLGAPIPSRDDPAAHRARTNPLIAMNRVLRRYFNYWWDQHHPRVTALDELERALISLGVTVAPNPGIFCREEFEQGEAWERLRRLARAALAESGMPPHAVPTPIAFEDYIEYPD